MIRRLSTPPGAVNWTKIRRELKTAFPQLVDVNEVVSSGSKVATYFEEGTEPTQGAVDAIVTAHDPSPDAPTPAETQRAADIQQVKDYVTSAQLDGFLGLPGDATLTQLTGAMKTTIRATRAIARLLRRIYGELE